MTIKTHSDVIKIFGGVSKLAGLMIGDYESDYHTVYRWSERESIPAKYWTELVKIAQDLDLPITYKLLAESK